jgi:probable HAF family extracellular repeat protein
VDNVANGINNLGQVVGWFETNGVRHAFLWQNNTVTDLGTFGGASGYAGDINDQGQVIGSYIPGVSVTASDPSAGEPRSGKGTGTFTFARTGSTWVEETIYFSVTGTATKGVDYADLGTSITIPAGSSTATRQVNVLDDAAAEGEERVEVTITTGPYYLGGPGSAIVTIEDDEVSTTERIFVTATTLGTLRNDFTGWVGMEILVGLEPLTVSSLGRMMAPGNNGHRLLKLVQANNGQDVPGGSVVVSMAGGVSGTFTYASLASPVTLTANTRYLLVSEEVSGEDSWYDVGNTVVTTTSAAAVTSGVYAFPTGAYFPYGNANHSYGPLSFIYKASSGSPSGSGSFITGVQPGQLRNDFTGWIGMQIDVGSSPITVTELGRMMVAGNSGTHELLLVSASDGQDVPGGLVTVSLSGGVPGEFRYGTLPNPVTLSANTSYFLVSNETAGGDSWHDVADTLVTTSNVAAASGLYGWGPGGWYSYGGANHAYGPVDFKYEGAADSGSEYVTDATLGRLRNDYTGWVGMQITVGADPVTVSELGRMVAAGNTGLHTVKLVRASDGANIAGGSVVIPTSSTVTGDFKYMPLPSPITLSPNTTYYFVSQETSGGDGWYDVQDTVVTTTSVASVTAGVYGNGPGTWAPFGGANHSYVPVSFKY